MRKNDTDSSEKAEEEVVIDQDSEDMTCTEEKAIVDMKVEEDYDDDNKLANAPAWVRYMPKTGWKHQSSSSDLAPVKATSTKYGKNKFCAHLPKCSNRKNEVSLGSAYPTRGAMKKKSNIHEVSLLLGYLK